MLTREHVPEAAAPRPENLFGLVRPHFEALDRFLDAQLAAFEPEVRELAAYCLDTSGKRIRPSLVFFSGWHDGAVEEPLVRVAAVIEMVHLATLVHDDIMDHAETRRRRATAARKFGADAAVLLGDALLAQAVNIAAQFPTTEVCRHISAATRRVCSGEIMQTLGAATDDLARYRRVIELKTAELFSVSCFLGARLGGASESLAGDAGRFGRHLGTAYQIYDDLADFFGNESKIGKTLGTDLASGRATLPLLLLLERLPAADAALLHQEMADGDARNIGCRVEQMSRLGVFSDVLNAMAAEIGAGRQALGSWNGTAAAALLGQLADLLGAQAGELRPR